MQVRTWLPLALVALRIDTSCRCCLEVLKAVIKLNENTVESSIHSCHHVHTCFNHAVVEIHFLSSKGLQFNRN